MHRSREVTVAPRHEEDVLETIRPLSMQCREGVLMVEEELEANDPDIDERCGLLADRFEVYAVRIPGCRGFRLAVSMDLRSGSPPAAALHGAVPARRACDAARRLATRHRDLIDPAWE